MKSPKGFGKKYFSLASIQAHTTQIVIDKTATINENHIFIKPKSNFKIEDNDPPCDLEQLLIQPIKPSHCNCYFNKKTKLALLQSKTLKKCNCHNRYFSFRRTGTHPPQ